MRKFFNKNEVNLLDIFIASDEILLDGISQNIDKYLRKTPSAWKFPKDFIKITQYKNILPNNLIDEIYKYLSDPKPNYNDIPIRKSPYFFNSNIINAKDAALIASWIDEKKGMPYRFKDIPFKFERIYKANSLFNNDDNKFKKTSKSFVFSLFSPSNGAVPRLSRVSYNKEAIFSCITRGPCFGFLDLWIQYNSSRRSTIGISIKHSYDIGIIDKEVFEIEDFEVFQIKKISVLSSFAKSIPEKVSGFIMYNEIALVVVH
ncbi:27153_t:CDS:2 [Gigaspora margarita]|uniref:27153_t:CDS:1 n=1 Tax=Gigaspora margarita TaxID=4874 RepID=A0ABN7UK43_GIGMA|nr:27153_t:CDS:2 [Gigaspora margarita]